MNEHQLEVDKTELAFERYESKCEEVNHLITTGPAFVGKEQAGRGKVVQQTNHFSPECNPPSLTHNPPHPSSCLSGLQPFLSRVTSGFSKAFSQGPVPPD